MALLFLATALQYADVERWQLSAQTMFLTVGTIFFGLYVLIELIQYVENGCRRE